MKEEELVVGKQYRGKTGNTFVMFRDYDPNAECFRRQDGYIHFGREFIQYHNGERVIDLEELNGGKR